MEGGDGLEEGLAEGLLPPPPMPPPGPQLSPGELGGLRVVLLPPPPLPPLLPPPPPVLLLPPSQYCEHTSVSSWASLLLLSPAAFGSCWVVPCSRQQCGRGGGGRASVAAGWGRHAGRPAPPPY